MPMICGVYGYQITQPIDLSHARIVPFTSSYAEAKNLARDLNSYRLTAVLVGDVISNDLLFQLEAILSFIEHLDVAITEPVQSEEQNMFALFPETLRTARRSSGGGAVIAEDTVFSISRATLIVKALDRLNDSAFCQRTSFRTLFFKCTETFRQRKPFIEVTYFLLFSGLETYARTALNDRVSRDVAVPITRVLKQHGFLVYADRPSELVRSISTYARLRNALFHNSEFTAERTLNGNKIILRLEDYLFSLSMLVSLVVLKALDFDDGHTNWDSWIDRQLFK